MINATIPSAKADLISRILRHLWGGSCKHNVLFIHELIFLSLFWPCLIPRYEEVISGRSPRYSVGFGGSLRRKLVRRLKSALTNDLGVEG